jgi:hypothetical protein
VNVATAERRWPAAAWIAGTGPHASVAYCRVTTVMLHDRPEDADQAKQFIDRFGCGGQCTRRHEVIDLRTAS